MIDRQSMREAREYLQEWCRNQDGEPLSDPDCTEIIDNLLDIMIRESRP